MRRAQDIPLVKDWYLKHCPPTNPLKSATRIRRCTAPNEPKPKLEKATTRKNLFRQLKQILPDDEFGAGLQICGQGYNILNLLIHRQVRSHIPRFGCHANGQRRIRAIYLRLQRELEAGQVRLSHGSKLRRYV